MQMTESLPKEWRAESLLRIWKPHEDSPPEATAMLQKGLCQERYCTKISYA